MSNAHENMRDVDEAFFALAWNVRREADMTAPVQEKLSRAIITYVENSRGRVRYRILSKAMEEQGFVPDDTADVVSTLEEDGKINPGGGGWVSLP